MWHLLRVLHGVSRVLSQSQPLKRTPRIVTSDKTPDLVTDGKSSKPSHDVNKAKLAKPPVKEYVPPERKLSSETVEKPVPRGRTTRLLHLTQLAAGMGVGAVTEAVKRTVSSEPSNGSLLMTESNFSRLAKSLSKMRGAALKLGQMLSIQDDALLPPALTALLARVRDNADIMPFSQTESVLIEELGANWKTQFAEFDTIPIAAASIGQVHKARLHSGDYVAVKVQYPGVAESIQSDLDNLGSLLTMTGLLPRGMYLENTIRVTKQELLMECDYIAEAVHQNRFKKLLATDDAFSVPTVHLGLSNKRVLTTQFVVGEKIDNLSLTSDSEFDAHTRNWVAASVLRLTLRELFEFKYMQTDPNWSNFLWNPQQRLIHLLDFGASREFELEWVTTYMEVVAAAALGNEEQVLQGSRKLGFLTGEESQLMNKAHVSAVMVLGEPFAKPGVYDFAGQNITMRIHDLIPIMLKHRLTPPPHQTYSLHRKLAGAFLLCAKLRAKFSAYEIFWEVYRTAKQQKQL